MVPQRQPRLEKTAADYLVIAISPLLIVLLVGSLVFFFIQVFYRGEMAVSIRWVMFWFVLAIVLVSRIGIEYGKYHAAIYGLALAVVTWIYLIKTHPGFLIGVVLLGLVWWCTHKLVWDCTLIDEDDDPSGQGLLQSSQTAPDPPRPPSRVRRPAASLPTKRLLSGGSNQNQARAHAPGSWVVYFLVAAIPLFGIGQVMLARWDILSRRVVFFFLFVYLIAALGLLLSTSFLGLRQYLRRHSLRMPSDIAFSWFRWGAGVAIAVLFIGLLLPRPGANYTWKNLATHVDHYLREASQYATRLNPSGTGKGRAGHQAREQGDQPAQGTQGDGTRGGHHADQRGEKGASKEQEGKSNFDAASLAGKARGLMNQARAIYQFLKWLLLIALAGLLVYWLVRNWECLLQLAKSLWSDFIALLRGLFPAKAAPEKSRASAGQDRSKPRLRPFSAYRDPFATGRDRHWSCERLIVYTYEALQAWSREWGTQRRPQHTPWEYGQQLSRNYPEAAPWAQDLIFYYNHVAFSNLIPDAYSPEPLRRLWSFMTGNRAG